MRREGTVTVLRAGIRDDGILTLRRLVVARRRDGRDGRLSYAALSGSCALGFVSSSLRPMSRSDRPTSTAAPSRTNPATTGTDSATPVSRETRRTPSRPTSLTVMAALPFFSYYRGGGRDGGTTRRDGDGSHASCH